MPICPMVRENHEVKLPPQFIEAVSGVNVCKTNNENIVIELPNITLVCTYVDYHS
jgi:hypothetical protein